MSALHWRGARRPPSYAVGSQVEADRAQPTIFPRGLWCSTVTCQGHPPSETPQPFVSLTLHILPDSVSCHALLSPVRLSQLSSLWALSDCLLGSPQVKSVDDALDLLTATESISGYKPHDHAAPIDATKVVRLQHLPPLLVLFLMRFDPASLHQKIRCAAVLGDACSTLAAARFAVPRACLGSPVGIADASPCVSPASAASPWPSHCTSR